MTNTISPKYEILSDDTKWYGDWKLYRIRALRDFADVKKGDLGGYVQYRNSLSHDGDAWIGGNARVFDARVFGNARVDGKAFVDGQAQISENARVYGSACIVGCAKIYGDAQVSGQAKVFFGHVCGTAHLTGNAVLRVGGTVSEGTYVDGWLFQSFPGLPAPSPIP